PPLLTLLPYTTLFRSDLFDSLSGSPDPGGIWTPVLASGTSIFDPTIDSLGTYTYSVGGNSICGPSSSTVTVISNPIADAGSDGRSEEHTSELQSRENL